ncbi:MAG: substrate-binding domain-containing protein [Gammaproteobacteria bacterium]
MSRIVIRPAWRFEDESGRQVDPRLFALLRCIRHHGALKAAVGDAGISYRHGWDLLKDAAEIFGSPLVRMQRGKGARLTTLGEKLLWAEQRSDASLFAQLDTVAAELNLEIGKARKDAQSILRIHASHGYAVEKLPVLAAASGGPTVDLRYMGSIDALTSLNRAECELAGFHIPLGGIGRELLEHCSPWLEPERIRVIRLVIRTQGLFLAPGNPRGISGLADLCRADLRFVNRQRGSGTRILLDGLLRAQELDPARITGYGSSEFTHAAVAAFVSSGMVDAAFGVEPAARQFGLDFLPLARERYMLACNAESLASPTVQELIALVRSPAFSEVVAEIPGYTSDSPGELIATANMLGEAPPGAESARGH